MCRLFLKSFILLSSLFILTMFFDPYLDNKLRKTNYSINYKEWDDIIDSKINADLLIQGSSRAWVHISPRYLDSSLKLNSYNLGLDGYQFHMQYSRFLLYLKYNKKPKYILQIADYVTLWKTKDLYMYEQFIPFLNEEIIDKAVLEYRGLNKMDIYVPAYRYIHNNSVYFNGLLTYLDDSQSNGKYKGFQAQNKLWTSNFRDYKKVNPNGDKYDVDTMTLRLFDTFIKSCIKENIKLILVNPPTYFESTKLITNRKLIDSIYHYYTQKYNLPFLDYSNDPICMDTTNFYNAGHLNATGVLKFNAILAKDLSKIIK